MRRQSTTKLNLEFDDGQTSHLTTPQGWARLVHWIATLNTEAFPTLVAFAEYCGSMEILELTGELTHALLHQPPSNHHIRQLAERILGHLRIHPEAESVAVTHGE